MLDKRTTNIPEDAAGRVAMDDAVIVHLITHGGVFHADDVFSTAFLEYLFSKKAPNMVSYEIHRVNDYELDALRETIEAAGDYYIVYDIGLGEFDHHQENSPVRDVVEGGGDIAIPYAAFGRLWLHYGHNLFHDTEIVSEIDRMFVSHLDAQDNGVYTNPLSFAIKAMNPNWDDDTDPTICFNKAVIIAYNLLYRIFNNYRSKLNASEFIDEALKSVEDGVMVLDRFVPYKHHTKGNPDVDFVIYPSARNSDWNIGTVITSDGGEFSNKCLLPSSWVEADDRYKPDGMTFCHKNRFIAAFKTKDQALAAAKLASAAYRNG